jgi:arylsulfatase
VPAIVRWPGRVAAGTVSDQPSAFYDWLPTLLDLTGNPQDIPGDVDGLSFAPTLLGHAGQQKQHEFLYWEFPAYGGQQAVRMGNWKAVRQNLIPKKGKNAPQSPPPTFELYDLKSDLGESRDVAAEHPDVIAKIKAVMAREHVPSAEFPFAALDQP